MSAQPPPADANMQAFISHYAPLPPRAPGFGEPMPGVQSFARSHASQPPYVQNQGLEPMLQFLQNPEGPWTSLNLQTAPGDLAKRHQAVVFSNHAFQSYGTFRNPPPSEADTISQSVAGIMSDSGYGSMAKQSVGVPSVCGDGDQSMELIRPFQAMGRDSSAPNSELGQRRGTIPAARVFTCLDPTCHRAEFKTRSELK